ncbi:MAG: DUF1150 family protein [Alphaproteobacteria bacterium]
MNAPTTPRGGQSPMSSQALLALGSMHVAYVKTVAVEGGIAYAIHAADGAQLAVFDNRDLAMVAARQHDLEPVSVH